MTRSFRMYDKFAYCEKCGGESQKLGWKQPKELLKCPDCGEWLRHNARQKNRDEMEIIIRHV